MKLYIVTSKNYNELGENSIKIFSDKDSLEKWLEYADRMEKELFGAGIDPTMPISKRYRIKESVLDNLDYIQLYDEARQLGAQVKPSNPQ